MPKQISLPGITVKKHNDLIQSKINIDNVNSSRILASLIACIYTNDKDFKQEYSVDVRHVLPDDAGGKSYWNIKNACKALAESTVETELVEKEKVEFAPFFIRVTYDKGFINAKFNPELKPLLIGLKKCFTQYNLFEYLELPSIYSQKIYEILKSWIGFPEYTITVEKLHHLLGTPKTYQANFSVFRRNALDRAYRDIHENTSLKYEWEELKEGRRVNAIRFILSAPRQIEAQKKEQKKQNKIDAKKMNEDFINAVNCYQAKGKPDSCMGEGESECEICYTIYFN